MVKCWFLPTLTAKFQKYLSIGNLNETPLAKNLFDKVNNGGYELFKFQFKEIYSMGLVSNTQYPLLGASMDAVK